MKNLISVQKWIQIEEILEKGVIKLKDGSNIKIIEIFPINYNLKSELEKEAILNSYKKVLKICNFNFQILIKSNKNNLNQMVSIIKNQKENNKKIEEIANNYIKYINQENLIQKSSAKLFYIIIKNNEKIKENIVEDLEEKYLKIKDNLSQCGNKIEEINEKEKIIKILESFFNKRMQEIIN